MTDFIWPSDQDRAESEELNRVCEYLEEVLDERDAWQRMSEQYKREAYALAAHVDRMERRGDQMAIELRDWLGSYGPDDETERMLEVWEEAKSRRPEASLTRLKAEWQAKGAQLTADSIRYEYEGEIHQDRIADHADEVADELRRQAEGGE